MLDFNFKKKIIENHEKYLKNIYIYQIMFDK